MTIIGLRGIGSLSRTTGFALATKLLHPRPKAMGVEQQSAVFETGRSFRFLTLAAGISTVDLL